jgi:mannose-6-phosphate isomerase-like protein (cupin superfamily)
VIVAPEFVVDVAELGAGEATPLIRHPQARLDYVLAGAADVRVGPRHARLGAGDCVYYPPGVPHALAVTGDAPLRYLTTYACEKHGTEIQAERASDADAERATVTRDTWVHARDAEAWVPLEPAKGLRGRFRRAMSREHLVELIAGVAEIDPGTHYSRHVHDQPEIYHVIAGAGRVFVGDAIVDVGPGASIYIPSRMAHGADSLGREPLTIVYVYACERAGPAINWTAVEPIYTDVAPKGLPR